MTDFWYLRIHVHNSKADNHCGRGGCPSDRVEKHAPLSPSNNLKNKNRLFRKRRCIMFGLTVMMFYIILHMAKCSGMISEWVYTACNYIAIICIAIPVIKRIYDNQKE